MADYLNIAGRVRTTASDGVAMESQEVFDIEQEKSQQEVNADVQAELADRYTKQETYNKEELDNMITTPDVEYVTVTAVSTTTDVTTLLPNPGAADTIYRVGNWNGTQYDASVYSEYSWNGSQYVLLNVKSGNPGDGVFDISVYNAGVGGPATYANLSAALSGLNVPIAYRSGGMSVKFLGTDGKYYQARYMLDYADTTAGNTDFLNTANWQVVDAKPTAGSHNLVESGGIADEIALSGVYDVTSHNSGATFASLSALLNDANLSTLIPTDIRKGGMSFKFVQSSDNKYVRYNLLADSFTTDTTKWAIDDNGVYIENPEFVRVYADSERKILWAIKTDGDIYFGAGVPTQVKDYIQSKISELSLDEYEDIVSFLGNLIEGDTLASLLNGKVDKVEGKSLIDAEYATGISYIENPEFSAVYLDNDKKILFGVKTDGDFYFGYGVPRQIVDYVNSQKAEIITSLATKVDKVTGKGLSTNDYTNAEKEIVAVNELIDDPEGRSEITTDSEGKIISYRDSNGIKHENVGVESKEITTDLLNLSKSGMTEFQIALINSGFRPGGFYNWSDIKELHLAEPYLAMINFLGVTEVPTSKTADKKVYMEFWDGNGNYFKKEVILNAQGTSSLLHPKRGMAIDICNNNGWDDDDTFKLQIGDWVPQDSFHIKAFYNDPFRCVSPIVYKLFDDILKTRGPLNDYVWKKALLNLNSITTTSTGEQDVSDGLEQFTNGAKCLSDGFPCIVYMEGNFYGIYSWQLKKHRDNYQMSKKKPKNIHLDGVLGLDTFFNHKTDAEFWTWFEVRNPKSLVYAEAHNNLKGQPTYKYDADDAGQFEIAGNSDGTLPDTQWEEGVQYPVNQVVWMICSDNKKHYFINTIDDNEAIPIYSDKNADDSPDFKNKTGCGWINCTITVQVKPYVLDVSDLNAPNGELNQALATYNASEKTAADLTTFRAAVETYFDADNLIDYLIVSDIVRNYDGFRKNWQWITYDGTKWYICMWDCDGCLGNWWELTQRIDPPLNGSHMYSDFPYNYILAGWNTELKTRYAELRNAGIITVGHIYGLLSNWLNRLGNKNMFDKEWAKWSGFIKNDSPLRAYKWIERSISNMDNLYDYNQN